MASKTSTRPTPSALPLSLTVAVNNCVPSGENAKAASFDAWSVKSVAKDLPTKSLISVSCVFPQSSFSTSGAVAPKGNRAIVGSKAKLVMPTFASSGPFAVAKISIGPVPLITNPRISASAPLFRTPRVAMLARLDRSDCIEASELATESKPLMATNRYS